MAWPLGKVPADAEVTFSVLADVWKAAVGAIDVVISREVTAFEALTT
jgi:hypothetical protein